MLLYFKSSAQFFFLQFSFSVWWSIECKYYDPSSAERVRFNEYYLSMQGFITFYSNLTAAALLKTSPINVWYFKSHIQQRLLLVSLFAFFSRWKNFVGFRGQKTMGRWTERSPGCRRTKQEKVPVVTSVPVQDHAVGIRPPAWDLIRGFGGLLYSERESTF